MIDVNIPWPLTNAPGQEPQEGSGRLINCHPDVRENNAGIVWRRAPGATVFARSPSVGAASGEATALGAALIEQMVGTATAQSTAAALPGIGVPGTAVGQSDATAVGST